MRKIILPGIVVAVVTFIIGWIINYLFMFSPSVAADFANSAIMRQMGDPIMMLFFLYPLIFGFILAWAWNKSKKLFKGTPSKRGLNFGLSIFLLVTIPGMFITYVSMPFAFMTILSWAIGGLINAIAAGLILARMNK